MWTQLVVQGNISMAHQMPLLQQLPERRKQKAIRVLESRSLEPESESVDFATQTSSTSEKIAFQGSRIKKESYLETNK
jgi:hypothetical protein